MTKQIYISSLLKALGFVINDGSVATWIKSYSNHENYKIQVDEVEGRIDYGNKIIIGDKTTSNLASNENFVVLECVNRLLEKGYKPKNITLEKRWATGHGTSGKLDILVAKDNGHAHLMIECKTHGLEFDKALKKIHKDGGQLFTYLQQDKNAEVLVLYTSKASTKGKIEYQNEIIKIEDDYRQTSNVVDLYDRWNKLTKDNGVFEEWVKPYDFESKALTEKNLKEITQDDSSFIFNQFLEILRHNVVSDKPNAFNKIFTLFLCKIYDEKIAKPNTELAFQWFYTNYTYEGKSYPADDNVSFQKRLTDLYKKGMKAFLDKDVTDISDAEFEQKYGSIDQEMKKKILDDIVEIRLKKNNEFAIKEVFDNESFIDNAKVVKEVVELLQGFRIRYTKKQQYLSDFFEMLLTTGLKQESGQFFTPVPVAQFIIKSLPLDALVREKLEQGEKDNYLPTIIDYASGSGHFLTESMHEIQGIINKVEPDNHIADTAKKVKGWQTDHFNWAYDYIYGIEKDYRLVKVGKVGCYLHGDGLAQIIHSDGLGNFKKTPEYKGLLQKTNKDDPRENKQFDIVISNPPYSVSAFKNNARKYYTEDDFELYRNITDQSSEIECLFIERAKQLLKDGGLAGIILPSSILSNAGIYAKAREVILKYFDVIAIAELGSNTFMATGTNTVTLFLRRRNNYDYQTVSERTLQSITNGKDLTIYNIQSPIRKYTEHVWDGIQYEDYVTFLKKDPNENIKSHQIYKDYRQKLQSKTDSDFWNVVIALETQKIVYFILAFNQKIVLVKSGDKQKEKEFLGYEFSNRRGNEGIHPIQKGKSIDECTKLFDPDSFDNPEKASTYIYQAFKSDFEKEIHPALQDNVTRHNLVDMMTFDRVEFDKTISLGAKKKINFEDIWKTSNVVALASISEIRKGSAITKTDTKSGSIPVVAGGKEPAYYHNKSNRNPNIITVSASGANAGFVNYFNIPIFASDCSTIKSLDETKISTKLIYHFVKHLQSLIFSLSRGQAQPHVYPDDLKNLKIPLPSIDAQNKIISEIEKIEAEDNHLKNCVGQLNDQIKNLICQKSERKITIKSIVEIINPDKNFAIKGLEDTTLVSFISMADITNDGVIENIQLKQLGEVKNGYTFFQEQDVLFAKITPCMENGKGALVPKLKNNLGFGSTEFFVLRKEPTKIIPKLLFYITKTTEFRKSAENSMTGASGHRRVPKAFIENYLIPDLTLPEQQKIISEIEKIEKEIATLQNRLSKLPDKKKAILQKHL